MRRNRAPDYVFVLALIVACAGALRIWGLGFGLPNTRAHPDESLIAHTAVRMLFGEFHPGFFNYPTLFVYADAAASAGYCAAAALSGRFSGLASCASSWPVRWEPFFLAGRVLSALAGTGAVLIVFALGRRLAPAPDRWLAPLPERCQPPGIAGLTAAACLATAFLHVRDSHFGVTDVAMTSMLLLALLVLLRADAEPAPRRFFVAGLLAGLAASTKYNAAILAAAALTGEAFAPRTRRMSRLPVFAPAMALGFLLGTPFALIDRGRFLADVLWESRHLAGGHGIIVDVGWRHHALVTLPLGVGWPLFVCGAAGGLISLARRPRVTAIVFTFPVLYYIVAGRGLTVFARYMVPVVPFLCLGAGALTAWLHERIASRRIAHVVCAVVVAACIGPNLLKAIALDSLLSRTDSRVVAAEWIGAHVGDGQTVYVSASEWGRPDLYRRGSPPPFHVEEDAGRPLASASPPDWIVVQQSPLTMYNGALQPEDGRLKAYDLRQTVHAYNPSIPHVYDQQDAFFLPLDGFAGVARPGPNFLIYERRASR